MAGTGISIKSGGDELVLRVQISPPIEVMWCEKFYLNY